MCTQVFFLSKASSMQGAWKVKLWTSVVPLGKYGVEVVVMSLLLHLPS